MVAGGQPAKPRWRLTVAFAGTTVAAASIAAGTCCTTQLPPIGPEPPPKPVPTVVVEAGPPVDCFSRTLPSSRAEVVPAPRIVGGHAVAWAEHRFAVSLSDGGHFCTGSLIADRWVLTAAHCSPRAWQTAQLWRPGANTLREARKVTVDRAFIHGTYDSSSMQFDFGLAHLSESAGIDAVDLADHEPPVGEKVWALGWGRTCATCPTTQELMAVEVPIVSRAVCSLSFGAISDRQVCAGEKGKDSCFGDSGGPLAFHGETDLAWNLLGATSFGDPECSRLGVYGNVSNVDVRAWIAACTRD